jgi:hypothetical protein
VALDGQDVGDRPLALHVDHLKGIDLDAADHQGLTGTRKPLARHALSVFTQTPSINAAAPIDRVVTNGNLNLVGFSRV